MSDARPDGETVPSVTGPRSLRARAHSTPGLALAWKIGVFLAGLLCITAGGVLVVLPGPLTIPPVLLGLWLWSTEFSWAQKFFQPFKVKGQQAWEHAKQHPISSSAVTLAGLVAAGAGFWAVRHYGLVQRALDLIA
jgi:hypothetical protein